MKKTAVVLAGGGSRGAYQIGAWKAMRELGIDYQLVTGTSVGALNGALMVQQDFDRALSVWENLSFQDVVGDMLKDKTDLSDRQLTRIFAREALGKGGADISALEHFIDSLVDETRFRSSDIDFALVTVEYPTLKPLEMEKKDIPKGMLNEYLLASAACFPAFQAKEIDGHKYIDGGYHDNMPINLALQMGAERIIAIDLESVGVSRKIKDDARQVAGWNNKSDAKQVIIIRSLWPLGSFLNFEGELARRNIRLGYQDARKAFGELDGQLYAFEKDSAFFYTTSLREQVDTLFEQISFREPQLFHLSRSILLRRMMREFRKRSQHTSTARSFTLSRQMMMSAEYLGEALGVEPTQVYEFGDFLRLLLEKAQECRQRPVPQNILTGNTLADLQKMGEQLQNLDRAFLVLLIRERIERFLQGGGSRIELAFVSAFWREFVAALFLLMLERMDRAQLSAE